MCAGSGDPRTTGVVRQVERGVRMNGPVAVGGVDVDGHTTILNCGWWIGPRAIAVAETAVEVSG